MALIKSNKKKRLDCIMRLIPFVFNTGEEMFMLVILYTASDMNVCTDCIYKW